MTRSEVKRIRECLEGIVSGSVSGSALLSRLTDELNGYDVKVLNASFDDRGVTLKLSVYPEVDSREAADFRRAAHSLAGDLMHFADITRFFEILGLRPEDLGRTFRSGGRVFRLVGYLHRARRLPMLCEDIDGRQYKLTVDSVIAGLREGVTS